MIGTFEDNAAAEQTALFTSMGWYDPDDPAGTFRLPNEGYVDSYHFSGVPEERGAQVSDHADVVIIGAGAGGATVGAELAEAGAKVVFLEAGKDLDITYGVGQPFCRNAELSAHHR